MNRIFFRILTSIALLASVSTAQSKSVLVQPFENPQAVTEQEATLIHESFLNRLQTQKVWSVIDTAKVHTVIPAGQSCDHDCLVSAASKLSADMILQGAILPTSQPGVVEVSVTLIDPASWREIQKETIAIGPEIEKGLGQISALAKLFDANSASSQASVAPDSKPDEVSSAAGWVLGGSALMVLVFVLYSLL